MQGKTNPAMTQNDYASNVLDLIVTGEVWCSLMQNVYVL